MLWNATEPAERFSLSVSASTAPPTAPFQSTRVPLGDSVIAPNAAVMPSPLPLKCLKGASVPSGSTMGECIGGAVPGSPMMKRTRKA